MSALNNQRLHRLILSIFDEVKLSGNE